MRKIIIIFILFLLFSTLILASSSQSIIANKSFKDINNSTFESNLISNYFYRFNNLIDRINKTRQNNLDKNFIFLPEDVELKDDAFHGSNYLHFTEWWYFDAIFDNGYSVQIGVRVLSLINRGLVHLRLDIYKDGELESHELKSYMIWDFFASEVVPLVELNRNRIIEGYIDDETGNWMYNLCIKLDRTELDLRFIGSTKGWKGRTPGGEWAVLLPRAEVEGNITLKDKTINVRGIGYHDHNWDVTLFTGINFGWYWGKVNSDNYTATWSKILTTRFWGQPILVINKKNGEYINIDSENIKLQIKDFKMLKGMLIPYSFCLDAEKGNISIHVDMDVFNVHHIRWMGMINYWRYHMRCKGYITIGHVTEIVDRIEIAEFIRFR